MSFRPEPGPEPGRFLALRPGRIPARRPALWTRTVDTDAFTGRFHALRDRPTSPRIRAPVEPARGLALAFKDLVRDARHSAASLPWSVNAAPASETHKGTARRLQTSAPPRRWPRCSPRSASRWTRARTASRSSVVSVPAYRQISSANASTFRSYDRVKNQQGDRGCDMPERQGVGASHRDREQSRDARTPPASA